jgi:hypothetical protein
MLQRNVVPSSSMSSRPSSVKKRLWTAWHWRLIS